MTWKFKHRWFGWHYCELHDRWKERHVRRVKFEGQTAYCFFYSPFQNWLRATFSLAVDDSSLFILKEDGTAISNYLTMKWQPLTGFVTSNPKIFPDEGTNVDQRTEA